jgi:type VII secretion integral membrane protein EccD
LSTLSGADLCRVTVVAPRVRLDVALPATVPLAGLLSTLLTHVGADVAEDGATHGGWALQRIGESPLDAERSMAALGVHDGEVLYFRPRQETLPAVAFDDPVDAVVTTLGENSRRWTTAATGTFSLAAAAVLLLAAATAALFTGPPWVWSAASCGAVCVGLVAAAGLVSRAFLPAAGTVLGAAATGYAFLGGLLALADGHGLGRLGAPQLLLGLAAALLVASVTIVVLDRAEAALVGVGAAAVLGGAGAGAALGSSAGGGAGIAVAAGLAFLPLVPRVAYRVAGLPQPAIPTTPEELRRHGEPLSGADIGRRALVADRTLTALAAAVTVVVTCAQLVLLRRGWTGDAWVALAVSASATVSLLLRARMFAGLVQRLWLLAGGLVGVVLAGYRLVAWFGPAGLLPVLAGALIAVAVVLRWAVRPGHRMVPPWARAADLFELAVTLGVVPLALQLLGAYGWARGLAG